MLSIVICDDDRFTLDLSASMINKCIQTHQLDAKIVCMTTNYTEMIVYLNNHKGAYLYFLDIDFGGQKLNGIDVARIVKNQEPLSKIVFVTSHVDLSMRVLKSGVEPFGFIEKQFQPKDMEREYKKYMELAINTPYLVQAEGNLENPTNSIKLPVGIDEYVCLDINQILYVESVKTISHFVCYHSVDGSSISVRDTIEHVLKQLGNDFMRSHRSVIINTRHVIGVSEGVVNFSNGETAACSFRLKNNVMKRCLEK